MFRSLSAGRRGSLLCACVAGLGAASASCGSTGAPSITPAESTNATTPPAACAGGSAEPEKADDALAVTLASELAAACPPASTSDEAAQTACAEALARAPALSTKMAEPVLWGQQKASCEFDVQATSLTRLSPLVFRRLYLSLFTFEGAFTVHHDGARTVLRMPYAFRAGMSESRYPYPFWHSEQKWLDYQQTTSLIVVIEGGRVTGALRSAERDPARVTSRKSWNGEWGEPPVTVFASLFAADNPHVVPLDEAFRALSGALREHSCTSCHNPANPSKMKALELFTFPGQALAGRHDIPVAIEQGTMPPPSGIPEGPARAAALDLAHAFEREADAALAWDAAHAR